MYEALVSKINDALREAREINSALEAWRLHVLNRERPSPRELMLLPVDDILNTGEQLKMKLGDIEVYRKSARTD